MTAITGYTRIGRMVPEEWSDGAGSGGVESIELFACEHCGAAVSESMCDAHTRWHQKSSLGMDFRGSMLSRKGIF